VTKREPTDPDVLHRRAQVGVLAGPTRGDDVYDLMADAALNHVPGRFSPDVALVELAVTAQDLACPPGAEPLEYEGLREHYLLEVTFRGRIEHRNSQYARGLRERERVGKWSPTNEGPSNCSVDDLIWMGETLVAVTHGRGMFMIDLSGV
jgi:hypothetical protein